MSTASSTPVQLSGSSKQGTRSSTQPQPALTPFGGIGAGAGIIANATGTSLTSAPYTTAFGYQALGNASPSAIIDAEIDSNTAFGYRALLGSASNFAALFNAAMGDNTLANVTSAASDNAFGHYTLFADTSGSSNNAFGQSALGSLTTGNANDAFGILRFLKQTGAKKCGVWKQRDAEGCEWH